MPPAVAVLLGVVVAAALSYLASHMPTRESDRTQALWLAAIFLLLAGTFLMLFVSWGRWA